MCHDAVIQITGYRDTITLDEIPLSSYDVIIGEPWMSTKKHASFTAANNVSKSVMTMGPSTSTWTDQQITTHYLTPPIQLK
jgi:hypothetical protein